MVKRILKVIFLLCGFSLFLAPLTISLVADERVEKIEKEIGLGGLSTEEMAFLENLKTWADRLKSILIVVFVLMIVALIVSCIFEAKKEQPEKERAKEEPSFPSLMDHLYMLIGTIGFFSFGWFIYRVIELIKLVSYEHLGIVEKYIAETTSAMKLNGIILAVSFAITTAFIIRNDSKRQTAEEDPSRA